jgi:hypothetical protein
MLNWRSESTAEGEVTTDLDLWPIGESQMQLTSTPSGAGCNQALWGRTQCGCQARENNDGHIPLSPLDLGNIGTIKTSLESKLLLRQIQGFSRSSHVCGDYPYDCRFIHHKGQIEGFVDF